MILADENINSLIIESVREIGIEVYSIAESNPGVNDSEVIELSRTPPRIILTEDKDFGEWVFAHHINNVSVIFLRYEFRDTQKIINILLDLLQERLPDLQNKFTTLTTKKIRIRTLPE